jgi:hypothetical protein
MRRLKFENKRENSNDMNCNCIEMVSQLQNREYENGNKLSEKVLTAPKH